MGVCVPEEHGGAGAYFLSDALVLEELARADAGVGATAAAHMSARTPPLLAHGDQQGLRVGRARRGPARRRRSARATSRSRSAGGMESMSQAPVRAPAGALRRAHGRHEGARRDGPRRADEPVHRQADVRRGDRGRRRARDDARRHGPLGAALARARDRGDRRRPPARGDGRRDGQGPEGRHGRRGRRVAAPRLLARVARQAARPRAQGGLAHRRQLARRQRRRRRARARLRRVGRARGQGGAGRDRRPGAGRRRLRLPRPHARATRRSRRSTRPACSRATSTCGRSTRRSPRSRCTRCACSGSTRRG